jgi:hypothetical protein
VVGPPAWLDVRRLVRSFSRDIPRDKRKTAEELVEYALKYGIVDHGSEASLARELAPPKLRRAIRRAERSEDAGTTVDDATARGSPDGERPERLGLPSGPRHPQLPAKSAVDETAGREDAP